MKRFDKGCVKYRLKASQIKIILKDVVESNFQKRHWDSVYKFIAVVMGASAHCQDMLTIPTEGFKHARCKICLSKTLVRRTLNLLVDNGILKRHMPLRVDINGFYMTATPSRYASTYRLRHITNYLKSDGRMCKCCGRIQDVSSFPSKQNTCKQCNSGEIRDIKEYLLRGVIDPEKCASDSSKYNHDVYTKVCAGCGDSLPEDSFSRGQASCKGCRAMSDESNQK